MIKSKDLNTEIKTLEARIKEGTSSTGDVVKTLCLLVKVLRDVRTNQTVIMKAQNIALSSSTEYTETAEKK